MGEVNEGPFSDRIVGYCTNVHAGATFEQYRENLKTYATSVRQRLGIAGPLPFGLWLSNASVDQLMMPQKACEFRAWLDENNLKPFTANAFPFGDFHQPIVKHDVYQPDWTDRSRWNFTERLLCCIETILYSGGEFSASTLPVGWGREWLPKKLRLVTQNLQELHNYLADEAYACAKHLFHVDFEPEPGCLLSTSDDVVRFFVEHLDTIAEPESIRRHFRVCHDICHAAVMFEDQAEMFKRYDDAGIKIGKVQVSNAIRVDFDALSKDEKIEALQQLKAFQEDRYLHQTCIRDNATGKITFHEDLPLATQAAEQNGEPVGEWRVHFHVPIYLESFGLLQTTRPYIDDCLNLMKDKPEVKHFEVETYAWNVLPKELQKDDLAEGIADELIWLRDRMYPRNR